MTRCPNSTVSGCRCPAHHPGIGAYSPDPVAYERMLQAIRDPVTLSVVTFGPEAEEPPCTGEMTCQCAECVQARAQLLKRGGVGAGGADPFRKVRAA